MRFITSSSSFQSFHFYFMFLLSYMSQGFFSPTFFTECGKSSKVAVKRKQKILIHQNIQCVMDVWHNPLMSGMNTNLWRCRARRHSTSGNLCWAGNSVVTWKPGSHRIRRRTFQSRHTFQSSPRGAIAKTCFLICAPIHFFWLKQRTPPLFLKTWVHLHYTLRIFQSL